jgi:hypothetical protein
MKRVRILLASAIILAIGSAFVTKASVRPVVDATFQQTAGVCSSLSTDCNTTGLVACGFQNIYKIQSSSSTCLTPLTQKN